MLVLLLSLGILLIVVAAMSIGVMMGRKPISGSCGGLGVVGISGDCEICGGNPTKCDDTRARSAAAKAVVEREADKKC